LTVPALSVVPQALWKTGATNHRPRAETEHLPQRVQ